MNNKIIIILSLAFAFFIIVGYGILSQKTNIQPSTAKLTYKYLDKNIDVELSQEDTLVVKNIFNNKRLYSDNPSCGFAKEVSISFDDLVFCPARDTCAIIKLDNKNKYFNISDKNRKKIEEIFEKYGGAFPCV